MFVQDKTQWTIGSCQPWSILQMVYLGVSLAICMSIFMNGLVLDLKFNPLHTCDLLAPQDGNHSGVYNHGPSDDERSGASQPEIEEASIVVLFQSQQAPSSPCSCHAPSSQQEIGQQAQSTRATSSPAMRTPQGSGFGLPSRRLPIGLAQAQALIYISFTDASDYSMRCQSKKHKPTLEISV